MNRSTGILLCAVATLLALGAVMVFSVLSARASTLSVGTSYLLKHALWVTIGIVAMLALRRMDYRRLEKHHWWILGFAVLLLIAVLVPGIGTLKNGARRWIRLGPAGFQPSEIAKLAVLISLSAVAAARGERMRELRAGLLPCVLIIGVVCGLILLETDVGTGVLIGAIGCLLALTAGAPVLPLAAAGTVGAAGVACIIWQFPQRLARVMAFLDPWKDLAGLAPEQAEKMRQVVYQVQHSLISLGSGGLFGRGLGGSRQKLFFLPEPDTDFIFAIIGEELGLIGTLAVLFLFVLIVREGMRVSSHAKDAFGALLAFGITCMIALQALIHVAVVTASMPTKGIALPFISSGGSSMVISLVGVGMLLSIASHAKDEAAETGARAPDGELRGGPSGEVHEATGAGG